MLYSYTTTTTTTTTTANTEINDFYLCGNDIALYGISGQIQSGWLTANTILGYTKDDANSGKTLTSDLLKM